MTAALWSEAIAGRHPVDPDLGAVRVGVLRGEGSGPEVVSAAVEVLTAACEGCGLELDVRHGPDPTAPGAGLSEAAAEFCRRTFAAGGAVLTGPHGGRWVYELRQGFDLFCKVSPIVASRELARAVLPPAPREVDLLVVREQAAGIYQGRWSETDRRRDGHVAEHSFSYSSVEVRRIVEVSAALASARAGRLSVVVKRAGIPSISRLWIEVAEEVSGRAGVACEVLDIDYAVYALLRDPDRFDVVVAPNLFGDVLADAGGVLLGSRGLCFGASFDDGAAAVYQTNHGSAHDLAGLARANPGAQILAAAALLRESFGKERAATTIERALRAVWAGGYRTWDLAEDGATIVGTAELGARVADAVGRPATREAGAGQR